MAGFDSALDALFKSSAGASKVPPQPVVATPTPAPVAKPAPSSSKRKHEKSVAFVDQTRSKRQRSDGVDTKSKDKKGKKKPAVDSSDDEDPAVEDSYQQRKSKKSPVSATKSKKPPAPEDSGSGSESDADAPPPVHESLLPQSEKPARKKKFVPSDETPEQRDARTIFIGNLPASAANNSARKALHKHILTCLQTAHPDSPKPKIESSRFRSVAFKTPTSKLPSDTLSAPSKSKSTPDPKSATTTSTTTSSDHNRSRAAEWRAAQDPDGSHKIFQTPAQKKKTAFITGALHDSAASSATAYVVFAHPVPVEGSEAAWDPVEVAARAVRACNGTTFKERTLRVDRVRAKGAGVGVGAVEEEVGEKGDPRTMVFVGNLDFEVHDDALRDLFEKLVEKERGAAGAQGEGEADGDENEEEEEESDDEPADEGDESEGEGEGESQDEDGEDETSDTESTDSTAPKIPAPSATLPSQRWVKSVRIIRDKDTQLGKGFGYVQFYDRASADEILAMEPGTIRLAKRKLRIQRCKTLPGATLPKPKQRPSPKDTAKSTPQNPTSQNDRPSGRPSQKTSSPRRIPIPRADPTLGDRIRTLSKDERKNVKSSDADRVPRRLAKKKARIVMERVDRKSGKGKESILGGRTGGPKGKGGKVSKGGKRERSDKAILKKNVKK